MKNPDRTALLIHCSRKEADRIREAAKRERRTISGFIVNAVLWRLEVEGRVAARQQAHRQAILEEGAAPRVPTNAQKPER